MRIIITICLLLCAVSFVEGTLYRVGVIQNEPYVFRDGNSSTPSGYIPDLLYKIAQILNVEYEYVWEERYGIIDEDGLWDGLVGRAIRSEVDIGAAPMTITSPRMRVVDFSVPFMNTGITIAMKKPTYVDHSSLGFFLMPFYTEVWLTWAACVVVFVVCMFLLHRFHPLEHRAAYDKGHGTEKGAQLFGAGGGVWVAATTAMLQGFDRTPRSVAGKGLLVIWSGFMLVTLILYSSCLNSLVQAFANVRPWKYESFHEIKDAGFGNVRMGYISGGSTMQFFRTSRVPEYEEVYSNIAAMQTTVSSIDEGIERVRDGRFALFMEGATLDYLKNRAPCDLQQVGPLLNKVGYGFIFPLGSDVLARFNLALMELIENGEVAKLYRKHWYDLGECVPDAAVTKPRRGGVTLTTKMYKGVAVFFIIGLLLTACLALCEVLFDRFRDKIPMWKTTRNNQGDSSKISADEDKKPEVQA